MMIQTVWQSVYMYIVHINSHNCQKFVFVFQHIGRLIQGCQYIQLIFAHQPVSCQRTGMKILKKKEIKETFSQPFKISSTVNEDRISSKFYLKS